MKMWAELAPFELNTHAGGHRDGKALLSLTEMKDAQAGLNFRAPDK